MKNSRGFSTIELLVVVVITGIVIVVGVPMLANAFADYRLGSATQQLSLAVQKARYLSTSQNQVYVLMVNPAGAADHPNYARIYVDDNMNLTPDTAKEIASVLWYKIPDEVTITDVTFGSYSEQATVSNLLVFEPNGTIRTAKATLAPFDPGDNTVRRPKMIMSTEVWGGNETMRLFVMLTRYGEIRTMLAPKI